MKKITFLLLAGLFLSLTSFSQVLPDNWTGDTGIDTYQESTTIHGGSYSCKIDVNTGTQANCDLTNSVAISVTAGNTFTFKFWANTSEFVRITGILDWVNASTQYSGQYVGPNTGGWAEFSFSGTVPSGATAVNLHIRCYDVSGFTAPETQYVDDFTFESPTGTPLTVTNGDMESWPAGAPPVIASIAADPQFPTSSESVSVSADATDDGSITDVDLNWGTSSGSLTNNINMSVSSGDTYTTDSDIPAQTDGTTIYYEIVATDNDANETTSDEQQYLTHDAKTATLSYSEDFTSGFGDLFPANVAGKKMWSASSGYAFGNGYNGDNPEEDWLILPGINLDNYSDEVVSFDTYYQYGADDAVNYLKLMYSTDYTGEGDPTSATWTEITTWTKPAGETTWTSSGNVDLSGISGTSVHLAYKYYSTDNPRAWRIDNISIFESAVDDPTNFDAVAASSSQIDLSWIQNGSTDNVMVAWSSDGIFGTPSGTYNVGDPITGGGTVLYNASGTSYNHTGLTTNTQYYYMAWSVDGSNVYSNGVSDDATTLFDNVDLYISEVADPSGTGSHNHRFVELVNSGASTINFGTEVWYLNRQTNGSGWGEVQLSGSIDPGEIFIIASNETEFTTEYGFAPDQSDGVISSNGDDGYFLTAGGDYDNDGASIIDAYGVVDQDGTDYDWEFLDSKAVRVRSVSSPNATWTASEWDVPSSARRDDMTPSEHKDDITWAGAGTTADDWNEKGGNWSGTYGYIPDASFNVTVPSTTVLPVVYGESACNDLTIQAGGSTTVDPDATLTAYGDLNTSGDATRLVVQSDATGNGSLIIDGLTDYATVQRYFAANNPGANEGWHNIASPVDFMGISGSDFDPGTSDELYKWDEVNYMWDNYKDGWSGSQTDLYASEGYLASFGTSGVREFTGLLTNIEWDYPDLSVTAGKGEGWHFLGNPFPSAIEWGTTDWALSNIGGVAQIWDNGNYTLVNAGDVIPSTNGFFVQASDATNYIKIPLSAKLHDGTNNYKNGEVELFDETLVLNISNDVNMFTDLTRVGFKLGASESYDLVYDAHKLFGSSSAPQLWSVTNNDNFAQSFLPYTTAEYPVSLHFRAGVNGTYHINASGLNSFFESTDIFLEDLLMDKIIDLNEQQMYSFTATTEDDEARFVLHFYGITSTGDTPVSEDGKIYAYQNTVYVQFNELPTDNYQVEVINMVGQVVYADEFAPAGLSSFKLNEKHGVYFVRLRAENKTLVQKVMISK